MPIGYLCAHSRLGNFDCGNDWLNTEIASWIAELPDPVEITVFVAHEDDEIRGFAAVRDLLIVDYGLFFLVAALAVRNDLKNGQLALSLLHHCNDMRERREGRRPRRYRGTMVTSFYDPTMEERYQRAGFRSLPQNPTLWYRLEE